MKVIWSPKEITDRLDVIKGDTWIDFAQDMQSADEDPHTTEFIIPAKLDFRIDDFPTLKTQEDHWKFTRFQICYWAYLDKRFNKPIQLLGFTSLSELRMLSGLPNVHSLIIAGGDDLSYGDCSAIEMAAGAEGV